jgi:hypothetical protein
MTSDIVERLRDKNCCDASKCNCDEAAAEIEKLRTTLDFAVTSHHEAVNTVISLVAERDGLRAALQWLLNDLQDYPASARPIAAYDNARAALGEKE